MKQHASPVARIFNLVRLERKEISAIYFYAIMNGLIQLVIPVGIQALIGFAQTNTASSSIVLLIVLVVVSVFTGGVMQVKQMQLTEKIQQNIFVRYSFDISRKIPVLRLSNVDSFYLPELINRFFDVSVLQKSLSKLLLDFPLAIIQIFFGVLLLSFYHPVFIAFGIMLIVIIWAILFFSGRRGLQTSLEESGHKYRVAAWLEEIARIIRSAKFSKSPDFHIDKTDDRVTDYLKSRTAHFRILQLQFKTLIVFKTLVTASMLILGTILLLNQQLNVGQFIAAEIVILIIINSVEKLISNLDSVYDVLTAVEKIENITDKKEESGGSFVMTDSDKGVSVQLTNTSFTYPDAPAPVLQKVDFRIEPNEKICIQGDESAGKSTLLRLLTGSYDEFEGAIMIDDVPIRNFELSSLRLKTGIMISQQDIFEGTLFDNITMGLKDVNQEELQMLCRKTGLSPYIATLNQGFDTPLSASGRRLPANVVKKILLVRALINKPRLLLLEEPWTGLEDLYQAQIRKFLLNEMPHTTVLVVTQDEDFASSCDKIIHLKNNTCQVYRGNPQIPAGGEDI